MKNALRSFAFVAALTFIASPMLHAERWGTNPHPDPNPNAVLVAYTVLAALGF